MSAGARISFACRRMSAYSTLLFAFVARRLRVRRRKKSERVDWMYSGYMQAETEAQEEYLLGKRKVTDKPTKEFEVRNCIYSLFSLFFSPFLAFFWPFLVTFL